MKKTFLQIIILFITFNTFSQSSINEGAIQIYSPEIYALARYGDIPVDHSTGIPDISVPLMSISDKDITVNISLSYHATGIKVDQTATWVGLGWSLNAGGMITRQVRGSQDHYSTTGRFSERPDIQDYDYSMPLQEYLNQSYLHHNLECLLPRRDNIYDGEPDIFYYNFCGRAGKFFLDNDAKGVFFKHEDFKIEFPDNDRFIITDDSGIIYEFTTSSFDTDPYLEFTWKNTWYLTKIVSPSGGEISIEYKSRYSENLWRRRHSTHFMEIVDPHRTLSHTLTAKAYHAGDLIVEYNHQYAQLSKIVTKSGHYINFNLSAIQRKDMGNWSGKALEEIVMYNNKDEIQKKISLGYDYFEANTSQRYKTPAREEPVNRAHLNYRLRLKSVKDISNTGESGAQYHFEYYGDDNPATEDPYTLPYRLSASQDHWGYYNYSNNITILPNNPQNRPITEDPWLRWYSGRESMLASGVISGGANREPDPEAVKAGTLNKIIYPTGGYTKFDFEHHKSSGDYSLGGGLRIKQIESGDGKGNVVFKDYEYESYWGDYLEYHYNVKSSYHTLLYNPYTYDSGANVPKVLMMLGVPADIIHKDYLHVIKIDGTSRLKLGMGNEAAYTKVIERTRNIGWTEYHYSCMDDFVDRNTYFMVNGTLINDAFTAAFVRTWDGGRYFEIYYEPLLAKYYEFPYPELISNQWRNRLLTNKKIYREDGVLVAEDSLSYNIEITHAIPNYKVFKLSENEYLYTRSYTIGGSVNVSKEVNRQYASDGKVIRNSKEYSYLSLFHKKPTEIKTSLSQGGKITEKYYYPTEYGDYFETLINKNILYPVDVRSYQNGKLISGIQVQYDSNGLPLIKYRNESMGTDIVFNQSNPFSFTPYIWYNYNETNSLKTITKYPNLVSSYLWGYNNQYPIAKIENATYEEVKAALGNITPESIASKIVPSETDLNAISNLRNVEPLKTRALTTTYIYKPLVGMTSETDPSGRTIFYEYDSFGRLEYVKDENGDILKKHEYHYAE